MLSAVASALLIASPLLVDYDRVIMDAHSLIAEAKALRQQASGLEVEQDPAGHEW
jgi:hypothetical protein